LSSAIGTQYRIQNTVQGSGIANTKYAIRLVSDNTISIGLILE
jgi:hypothetical protein